MRIIISNQNEDPSDDELEEQEDQLDALGLVVNAIVLWNTRYMAVALNALRKDGLVIDDADVQRLSPLEFEHINIVGRYSFNLPEEIERWIASTSNVDREISLPDVLREHSPLKKCSIASAMTSII